MLDFLNHHTAWYVDFIRSPLFAIALTVVTFQISQWLYGLLNRFPLMHPTIVSAAIIAAIISFFDISYKSYFSNSHILTLLLGPTCFSSSTKNK